MRGPKRMYRRPSPLRAGMGQKKQAIVALLEAGMPPCEISRVTGWSDAYCCRLRRDVVAL